MRSRSSKSQSTAKTLILVFGILGFLALTAALACGGLIYFFAGSLADFAKDVPVAQSTAESVFSDLQQNQLDAAYGKTSQRFKSTSTAEQFRAFVVANPALTSHTQRTVKLQKINGGTGGTVAVFQANLTSKAGQATCSLTLVKENGQWVVQHLSVP